jgi:hypothetical protein
VSTNLGSLLVALPVKDNEIRFPLGHVAVNAVASGLTRCKEHRLPLLSGKNSLLFVPSGRINPG